MPTIKDVAKEANVAISTVSNVLNNIDVVSEETKMIVLEAVKKLNYTPNLNGKYLKKSKTGFIGVFLTTVAGPYFSELIDAMHQECRRSGYGLTVFLNDKNNVEESFQAILGKRVDGAIILNETIVDAHVELFKNLEMPIVFLDRVIESNNISSVVINNFKGMQLAVTYLLKLGHTSFGYLHGHTLNYDESQRYEGYRMALLEHNIEHNPEYEMQGFYAEEGAYHSVRSYIASGKQLPQAIIAANDQMACGCIDGLKAEGYRVPEDVSIIGFDNIDKGKYFSPSITTVDSAPKNTGRLAVEILVDIIKGNSPSSRCVEVELVIRDSCRLRL